MTGQNSPPRLIRFSKEDLVGDRSLLLGVPEAPFSLVEFADYQCPPCAVANPLVKKILSANPKKINFRFRNFPLPMHEHAKEYAIFTEMHRPSIEAYWSIHDFLYEHQATINPETLLHVEKEYPNIQQTSRKVAVDRVDGDIKLANTMSVHGTPSFYLCNDKGEVFELANVSQVTDLLK